MNFYDHYKIYSSGNEADPVYHRWAALATVSALVGRKVWCPQGMMARVYTNIYCFLVGDPASGKSVAMDLSRNLIRQIGGINFSPAAITTEALLQLMGGGLEGGKQKDSILLTHAPLPDKTVATYTPLHICANELVTLLGGDPMKIITFLTDVYDREVYDNFTKNKGNDLIRGPYITILGGLTPDTIDGLCRTRLINGGFARRVFFVVGGDRINPNPRPVKSPAEIAAELACVEMGRRIKKMSGEFQWTDEGGEYFDSWYKEVKHVSMRNSPNLILKRWYSAKDVLLVKIAMLLALGQEEPVLELTRHGLETALKMLDGIEKDLMLVLGGAGRNEHAAIAARMLIYIKEKGQRGATQKEIIGTFYSSAKQEDIQLMLNYLVSMDEIKVCTIPIAGQAMPGYVALSHPLGQKSL